MQRSQVWLLGKSTYWWRLTKQFKTFIDRWYGSKWVSFAKRCAIFVISIGGSAAYFPPHIIEKLIDILNYLGRELMATVLIFNSYGQDVVHKMDILAKTRYAGREAIKKR